MNKKSINEVVKEFKDVFGLVEFKAINNETGQVGGSRGWQEQKQASFEIDGADYLALGQLNAHHAPPSEGVIINLLKLAK